MNLGNVLYVVGLSFLNGVCRHELFYIVGIMRSEFLNGVCRHEPAVSGIVRSFGFLNGVCRHELMRQRMCMQNLISKWRMPP